MSFLASVWLVVTHEDCMDNILGESILSMLMSAAIFIIILRLDPILAPAGKILALASKYSYSIILIHWYVQIRVIHNNIFNPKMNPLLLLFLPILGCILLSWVISWIVDRLVVDLLLEGVYACKILCCEKKSVSSGNRRKDGKNNNRKQRIREALPFICFFVLVGIWHILVNVMTRDDEYFSVAIKAAIPPSLIF